MLGFAPASAIESTEKATSKVTRDQPASKLPLEPELRGLYSQAAEAFADGRFSEAASGFERVSTEERKKAKR
jgi:outer membrane protein assembly factor BamD (BamD/ComL family)